MTKSYIYTDTCQIICQRNASQAAAEYFYVTDRLGSVRQVIDNTGSVVANYTYSPFGQMLEQGGSFANSLLFTGQWFDSEFGQYYLRARQYDPVLMRFGARDPVSGKYENPMTLHPYLYCLNDTVNKIDLSGQTAWNLVTPILTGHALHTQAINLASYAVSSGDLRFIHLAELTVRFTPVAVGMATASSVTQFWVQFLGTLLSLQTDPVTSGMGASGLLVDGWTGMAYSALFRAKANQIGVGSKDINDFLEWKGGFWSEARNFYGGTRQVWDFIMWEDF